MPRRWGPACPNGHNEYWQRRLYIRSSATGVQRYRPYCWQCGSCGELHDYEKDLREEDLPVSERNRQRAVIEARRHLRDQR